MLTRVLKRMSRTARTYLPLAISVLIHIALLELLVEKQRKEKDESLKTVEITPLEIPRSSGGGSGKKKAPTLKDLVPGLGEIQASKEKTKRGGESGGTGNGPDFLAPMGFEEYAPLIPFMEALWSHINKTVDYPDDMINHHIEGVVTVRLSVDGQGRLRNDYLRVRSSQPMLQSYVITKLLHGLKESLPKKKWTTNKAIHIVLIFDFQTYSDSNPRIHEAPFQKYAAASLNFPKHAYAQSIIMEQVDKLMDYVMPIMFVEGGFIVNFVRLHSLIKRLSSPTEFELRSSRLAQFRSRLDRELQLSNQQPTSPNF